MNKPAKFVAILYDILEQDNFKTTIRWTKDGKGFYILRIPEFQSTIMEEFFNTQNFQSFLRQLSLYGFKMKKNEKNQKIYNHPLFFQGNYQELYKIQRRKKAKDIQEQYFDSVSPQISINNMRHQLEILRRQQQQLLMQMRIQFQIQFLIAKKINAMVDHFNENHTNEQRKQIYEKPMHLLFQLIFGHKPEFASNLMEPLYEDLIGQLSPFSEFPCSPIQFAKFL
ncbi:unnamed protein product [Paramecium primaurelia]|uniref:HSF-type DNA-binding domain-containing protein n=1 Tax=Paramecium primaurelia TaxID=5886 RepID=A0A8S1M2B8_PARPR|nr:unnamed protein product [Paramecium primaurelia]